MKNAHLRFGWLTYIKSTEKTTSSIRLHLDRFIGELSPDPPRQAKAHLISVIGGDTQIAAIGAAISVSDRFMVEGPGVPPTRVCLDPNAGVFKGSIPLTGRKKPLCHLVALSEKFAANAGSASSGKTLLASSNGRFVWSLISEVYGVPGIPEWADWFAEELKTQHAIAPAVGIGCHPAIVKGNKEQFLDWLSWAVESNAIDFPAENASIVWPGLTLDCIFR
jgi:hypothetical protein